MFWTVMLITGFAIMLVKLGAYSVMVSILTSGLCLALLVIACLTIALLWRKVFGGKKSKSECTEPPVAGELGRISS